MTRFIKAVVIIEVNDQRLNPNGPVDHLDDGAVDILGMVERRIAGAFSYVDGYERPTIATEEVL